MTDAIELGVAYINLVPSASGITAGIQREMGLPLEAAAKSSGAKVSQVFGASFASKAQAQGKSLTKNLTVPLLAVGAIAVASAVQLDGAYHTIEQRTGTTGAKLRGLNKDFDAVNKGSAASMGHIADIISQFNQRLDLSGAPLQAMTKEFLVLERVAGQGAPTVDAVAKAMVAWHVATSNQASELDHLFVASQKTGAPMATLVDDVTKFAPQMRAAGMSIDSTTVLMGTLEKAGVPVSKVFMGINTYLSKVAKSGEDTHGAFQNIINQAAGLDKTGQKVQATTLLVDAFGSRAGLTISQLVADGKLSGPVFDQLAKEIANSTGQILKVGADTLPLSVRLGQAWKAIQLDLAPIGQVLIPDITGALQDVIPVVGAATGEFSKLPHAAQEWGVGLAVAAAAAGPALRIGGRLASGLATAGDVGLRTAREIKWMASDVAVNLGTMRAGFMVAGTDAELGFGMIAEGANGALLAMAPLLTIGAVVGTTFEAFRMFSLIAKDASAYKGVGDALNKQANAAGITSAAMFKLDLAQAAAGKSVPGLIKDGSQFQAVFKLAHVSVDDFTKGITGSHAEWVKLDSRLKNNFNYVGFAEGIGWAQGLRNAFERANNAGVHLTDSQKETAGALLATGASAQSATTDAQKLTAAFDSADFKASKLTVSDVTQSFHDLGLTVADVTAKGFNFAGLKQSIDDLKKLRDSVSQTVQSTGDLASIDPKIAKSRKALSTYFGLIIADNNHFAIQLREATARGIDPQTITQLMIDGPQKAGPILDTILKGTGDKFIKQVNLFETAVRSQAAQAADAARILFEATQGPKASQQRIRDMPDAQALSAMTNIGTQAVSTDTLMKQLGLTPERALQIGKEFGLTIPIKGNIAPALGDLTTLQYTVNRTTGAVQIGGIDVPANNQLAILLDKIGHSRGDVTLDADQRAGLLKIAAWQDAAGKTTGKAKLDADSKPADDKVRQLGTDISKIPFVGSFLAASLLGKGFSGTVSKNSGGMIPGGGPDRDSVLTHLTPGEYVHNRGAVNYYGMTAMDAINQKKALVLPGFNAGGLVPTAWVDANAVAAPAIGGISSVLKKIQLATGNVAAAETFLRAQVGKPYLWGAVGPSAYDCSGLASAGLNVLHGRNPYSRDFTSASLPGSAGALGLVGGLGGPFEIGDKPGSHVALTVNGVNFEATPPFVRMGPGARGANSSFFTRQFHAGGGFTGATASGGDFGAVDPRAVASSAASSIFGFSAGGLVPGTGIGDKVLAALEPGEFVLNSAATHREGVDNLLRVNSVTPERVSSPTDEGSGRRGPIAENLHLHDGADIDLFLMKFDNRIMASIGSD